VGEKWQPYSATCLGHRHDQSILSILTQRANCPRVPLKEFYNDRSLRAAQQLNVPLYVHRGQFRSIVPFAEGIDEAYVINLDKRQDRLERFKTTHASIKDRIYRWKAVDGLALTLTPQLVECFKNNDFGWKKAVMGCALSHLGLWEKLANDTLANSYMILEDDVLFSQRWLIQWAQSAANIPSDADVIYLGGVLPPNKAALPMITEQVNKQFARVAKNTVYGTTPRRYFHFCNYSYVLTKRGAQKLVTLIKERGIFTSGDHMIVNHGDELLNIYFTTPLMTTCYQEDDPVYQKSEFNNFQRIDKFDSDLWNNNERFTKEDVERAMQGSPPVPTPVPVTKPVATTVAATVAATVAETIVRVADPVTEKDHESHVRTWNTFLRHIAAKDSKALKDTLAEIFAIWRSLDYAAFQKNIAWFRIFEQMVQMKHESLMEHSAYIVELIRTSFPGQQNLWANVLQVLVINTKRIVYHRPEINPATLLEAQWFNDIFSETLEYRPYSDDVPDNAIILHQIVHGKKVEDDLFTLLGKLYAEKKRVTLLHISDEFGSDDIRMYNSPAIKKVLRNYWRPDISSNQKVQIIPLGYANDRQNKDTNPSFSERTNLWGFAGSLDRAGRSEALAILRGTGPYEEYTKENWSSPSKLGAKEYTAHMRNIKFVPCFRGSHALESYRFYEALELGAIPIYVPSESHRSKDEYVELYGKHPFLGFPSWQKAAEMLPVLAKQPQIMEKHRESIRQWWSEKKAKLRGDIDCIPPFNPPPRKSIKLDLYN
jgi:GR25 family glycosyltransferase involved in LPS biosynthesis